jgi:hypothetical protein
LILILAGLNLSYFLRNLNFVLLLFKRVKFQAMIVIINRKKVELFRGATVNDAIRTFSQRWHYLLVEGKAQVTDRFGNLTEPDGELTDNQVINIKKIK